MQVESVKVSDGLYLVSQTLAVETPAVPVVVPTHHILWVDCSGSMYGELSKVRQHMKNKLATLVNEGDVVTIGWFSSRGQYGTLFEALPVRTLRDLTDMHKAIDRFLQPMGATGFRDPIRSTLEIIDRTPSTHAISFFFLTDGYDNCSSKKEIIDAVQAIAPRVASATYVEYGYYANRQLLSEMAEQSGGALIFCEDFRAYEPAFEAAMQKKLVGGKKITVNLEGEARHKLAFAVIGNDVVAFAPNEQNAVMVPEGCPAVYFLSETPIGDVKAARITTPIYAAAYLMSQRMKTNDVFALLKATGDVRLIKTANQAIGKQKISEFQNALLGTVSDDTLRLVEGFDPSFAPADDCFTLIDLLNVLIADDEAKFYPGHPSFKYKRTGRKAVTAQVLSEAEQKEIMDLTNKATTVKALEKVQARMDEMIAAKGKGIEFEWADKLAGVPVNKLTFNETRPNISVLARIEGHVDLSSVKAEHGDDWKLDEETTKKFPTNIHRNYTVIADGVVNVDVLPVSFGADTYKLLETEGLVTGGFEAGKVYEVNLRAVPVVNRKMAKEVSAKRLFELSFAREKIAAAQKVFKEMEVRAFGKKASEGWKVTYGETMTNILKEAGLTDYSGFSPKTTLAEATDVYQAVSMEVKIPGLSSLPKVADVEKIMDANAAAKAANKAEKALTIAQAIMAEPIQEYRDFIASSIYTSFPEAKRPELLKTWLSTKAKDAIAETRKLIREIAQIKFSVIMGPTWFTEFATMDENSMEMDFDGRKVTCVVELKDIEEKL